MSNVTRDSATRRRRVLVIPAVAVGVVVAFFAAAAPSDAVVPPTSTTTPHLVDRAAPRRDRAAPDDGRPAAPDGAAGRPARRRAPTTTEPRPTTTPAPAPTTTQPSPAPTSAAPSSSSAPPPPPPPAPPSPDVEPQEQEPGPGPAPSPPCVRDAIDDYYTVAMNVATNVPYAAGLGINDVLTCGGPGYTIADLSDPPHGIAFKVPNDFGAFIYQPDFGYTGPDTFTYTLYQGAEVADQAEAHINVTDGCAAIAFADFYTTPFETPLAEAAPGLLGNDTLVCQPNVATLSSPPSARRCHRRRRRVVRRTRRTPGSGATTRSPTRSSTPTRR